MSHWQKTKLKHKEGQKRKEIEEHFGIKTMKPIVQKESKKEEPVYKKEFKSEKLLTKSKKKSK